MSAAAGPVPQLPLAAPVNGSSFTGALNTDMHGVRIGWSANFGIGIPVDSEVAETLEAQLSVFEELGAVVEEATIDFSEADAVFHATRAMNFAEQYGELVRAHRDDIKPEVVWNVEAGWSLTAEQWIETTAASARLQQHVRTFFDTYDVFLSPAAQVVPFEASLRYPQRVAGTESQTYLGWMRSASVLSTTSLPVLSVPGGFTAEGLPVGFQMAAAPYRDVQLLGWGAAFEDRTRFADQAPTSLP